MCYLRARYGPLTYELIQVVSTIRSGAPVVRGRTDNAELRELICQVVMCLKIFSVSNPSDEIITQWNMSYARIPLCLVIAEGLLQDNTRAAEFE